MDDMEPTAEDIAEYVNTAGGIDNPYMGRRSPQRVGTVMMPAWKVDAIAAYLRAAVRKA